LDWIKGNGSVRWKIAGQPRRPEASPNRQTPVCTWFSTVDEMRARHLKPGGPSRGGSRHPRRPGRPMSPTSSGSMRTGNEDKFAFGAACDLLGVDQIPAQHEFEEPGRSHDPRTDRRRAWTD